MKRAILLSAAACACACRAASLRGPPERPREAAMGVEDEEVGVEEVGACVERFPREEPAIDRRVLLLAGTGGGGPASPGTGTGTGKRGEEEPHDPWPERDVVGTVVEDPGRAQRARAHDADEEEDGAVVRARVDDRGRRRRTTVVPEFAEAAGGYGDDPAASGEAAGERRDGGAPATKEYRRDPRSRTLLGGDLLGGAVFRGLEDEHGDNDGDNDGHEDDNPNGNGSDNDENKDNDNANGEASMPMFEEQIQGLSTDSAMPLTSAPKTPSPTRRPSKNPTDWPTYSPTRWPTYFPTVEPTPRPTRRPTRAPVAIPPLASTCSEGLSELRVAFATDFYAYENRWYVADVDRGTVVASGPPGGTNYADDAVYVGRLCLPPGRYWFRLIDRGLDGICSDNGSFGCGELRLYLNGQDAGRIVRDTTDWRSRDFQFYVAPSTGELEGADDNYVGAFPDFCSRVREVMEVPPHSEGTCELPDGRTGHRVSVTTRVDRYGRETSWTIAETEGNVVRMKMRPVIPANGEKTVEGCLPDGRYNLKFKDPDGVCCRHGQGFFRLDVNDAPLLEGGSFTGEVDHDFQLGFDWVSSMSERDCEWWWAHDYRRRDWHSRCYEGKYCDKPYRHLKWSPALRADAQDYANRLLDTCDQVGIEHDATDQGENLAKNRGSGAWGAKYPADKITKRFVDNEEFWGWNDNAHLTQAMWYSSRYVGCADSVKRMGGNRMCRMQVCRYAKAGNCQMGKYESEVGNNWMIPMMMDDSPCGPTCASRDGCYH